MRVGVTGISGSLGTALTKKLVSAGLGPIIGITRDEFKAEQISGLYGGVGGEVRVMVVSEGIADTEKLKQVFRGCEVLIHCAAQKRISGSVYAAEEMMQTNCIGTMSVLRAATAVGISKVLVISSDKACEPTSMYGATKQVAECIAVQHNSFSYPRGTRVSVARYGNVIGSRGSVIPLWKERHAQGETLMLTHKDMVRFMITMDQAVDFVLACIFSMKGGEIILPILPSARMYDVALAICREESKIIVKNELRPGGEKMAEIMLSQEEPSRTVKRVLYGGFNGPIEAYAVLPSHRTWSTEPYPGELVQPGLSYRSDTNTWWLTIDELRSML